MQAAADCRAASACGRTPRPTRARSSRAGRSIAAPIGICCAKLGEAEVFADAGHRRHPPALSAQSRQRRSRDRAARSHAPLVHRRSSRRGEAVVRRHDAGRQAGRRARQGGRRVPSLRHRSRRATMRSAMIRGVAALPGLSFRGLLSHAGHAYHAHSEDELRQMAEDEARDACAIWPTRCRKAGVHDRRGQRRRDAAGALLAAAGRLHRVSARQLRLLRSHAGGARRRDARRLRAHGARDGRQQAGQGSRDLRLAAARH